MTLLYFEGFDLHTKVSSLDGLIVGDPDTWYNWQTGTLFYWRPSYVDGYLGGQAIHVSESFYSSANTLGGFATRPALRMGWWGAAVRRDEGLQVAVPFLWFQTRSAVFSVLNAGMRVNLDGTIQLFENNVFSASSASIVTDDAADFNYYEIYCNTVTGTLQLSVNGTQILTQSFAPSPEITRIHWNAVPGGLPFPQWDPIIDHLWITDGDELDLDLEVLGVSIGAAQDSYSSGTHGFRGTMMIDGDRYASDWTTSATSSIATQFSKNAATVTPFFFFSYPVDDTDWTQDRYEDIEAWGVCFAPTDETPGEEARLDALSLNRLIPNDGMPLVVYDEPGTIAQFSGSWRKSDETLSYAGHVSDIPRDDIAMADDATSLFSDTVGCILFSRFTPPDDPDDPDRPLQTIGITFAEEFREDYTDFLRVDGVGTDYDSYAEAGYSLAGESHRRFQSNYVTVNYEVLENGGAYVRGIWDYSISASTGEWSMSQQVYRLDKSNHKHALARLKFRGNGRAFQFRVESQTGKAFSINGWAVFVTLNENL